MSCPDELPSRAGSESANDLSTPLYVVVDQIGRIAYAGSGGTDLSELMKALDGAIAKPLSNPTTQDR
jgi:hypothetical protein